MSVIEVLLIALVLVAALATLADRLRVPYPILLLLGGLALGLVPGLPRVTIDPSVLFLLFIPPLVISSGWTTSWRDFRANLWPISLLSVGLVLATIVAVAMVAHLVLGDTGLSWPAAFVLGAVVSSTDPVAATAIAERLRLPVRIVTILEGEGVGNDGASLVAYRTAVAATITGAFALAPAVLQVILAIIGGVAIGLAVAVIYGWIERHLHAPPQLAALTLVLPYAAYIPADRLGLSGVIAVLTAGIWLGRREPQARESGARLEVDAFWESLVYILNGLIFVLLGLYLPEILGGIAGRPIVRLLGEAIVIIAVVVLVRIVWVFAMPYVPATGWWWRRLQARSRGRGPVWKRATVVAWSGMRGADTLVLALALPLTIAGGAPFPQRALIIFVTAAVIAATLIGQGLTLPPLIRWLGLHEDDTRRREEAQARLAADDAGVAYLDELLVPAAGRDQSSARDAPSTAPEELGATSINTAIATATKDDAIHALAQHLRHLYARRARRDASRTRGTPDHSAEAGDEAERRLRLAVVEVQRQAIIALRDRGAIGDDALREVLRDLDLEEQELE
jgi:monovalent cation/hydrogen antiporter